MFKIKKAVPKAKKPPILYNIIEDYTEYDAPGNVTLCATTETEDLEAHARVLVESHDVPLETMTELLLHGGVYQYPQSGAVVTRGLFQCWIDPDGQQPKQTWVLDVSQYAEAEQLRRSYGLTLGEAGRRVFLRTLPAELQKKLREKNLGLDYKTLDRSVARGGDIKYIDFRRDWSPHFKRLCIMPDGRLVATSGIEEFAELQGISVMQATRLLDEGGILEVNGEVLACQIVNGQPSVARFSRANYAKARQLVEERGIHILDALSKVAYDDPALMTALKMKELRPG